MVYLQAGVAWAATRRTHTPRMAAMAIPQGIASPRLAHDEMTNLLGPLRSASASPPRGTTPPGAG